MRLLDSNGPFLSLLIPDRTMGLCEVSLIKRDGELEPAGVSTRCRCLSSTKRARQVMRVLKRAGLKHCKSAMSSISVVFHKSMFGSYLCGVRRIKISEESLESGFPLVRLQGSSIVIF